MTVLVRKDAHTHTHTKHTHKKKEKKRHYVWYNQIIEHYSALK